ncbi:MAG: iron complex outermembrane receptor protein, partial [Halieaceae bacterium]
AFQGGGINDGAQGPDISVIPSIALKQVEVLRDGASAQYGSDAIAGVINFILKDDSEGGSLSVKQGEFFEGDGAATVIEGNIGLPLTDAGFVNVSFSLKNQDDTSRGGQRGDAQALIDAGNTDVPSPAMIWGMPKVDDDFAIFVNAGLELGNDAEAYLFGNFAERDVDGGFYYRNPNSRGGVFTKNDGANRLVGDLTADRSGNCSQYETTPLVDGSDLAGVMADPNCFVMNEVAPGGYTPRFTGNIADTSLTAGTRGQMQDINYDVSFSVGRSESDFGLNNTVNPSMGPDTPRSFKTGSYIQLEKTFNLDLQKQIGDTSVAGGVEWREESFEVIAGDSNSWKVGPLVADGFNVGSHGFAGFSADSAGEYDRRNYAVYADVESHVTENWLIGGAIRYEDYDSFGSTTNYKVTTHVTISDTVAVRFSHSTGFRAPTMGQANVVNTQTSFDTDQNLIQVQTIPGYLLGEPQLEPEESVSFAAGLILNFDNFDITIDAYQIEVEDRVAPTASGPVTLAQAATLTASGIPVPDEINWFANDFDTKTSGIDLVATTDAQLMGGDTNFSLAYNYNKTEVTNDGELTDSFKRLRLERALPEHRAGFTIAQNWDALSAYVRFNYYGEYLAVHADSNYIPNETYGDATVTVDIEASYRFSDTLTLTAGASNITDEAEKIADGEWTGGADYYETAPYGMNGGFYYMKASYNF